MSGGLLVRIAVLALVLACVLLGFLLALLKRAEPDVPAPLSTRWAPPGALEINVVRAMATPKGLEVTVRVQNLDPDPIPGLVIDKLSLENHRIALTGIPNPLPALYNRNFHVLISRYKPGKPTARWRFEGHIDDGGGSRTKYSSSGSLPTTGKTKPVAVHP